ncbi:ABC transporter substrate-binding protein [Amycolatopsis pithecellobii]|uniref:ABC transporter substrate-binding protein n=1 Tax=Amycolatopsis pithecellobii TaxID=664692 RepID=A0A6N7YLC0_9PSEU|nr:ABC transporter substrate-binding protein [Amycolatopsis pithecellobii]MTD53707.1 ABC transporter substrate-binding protein [Amycolatopsis pithecellobii]
MRSFRALAVLSALLLAGCAVAPANTAGGEAPVTVQDCQGRDVTITSTPRRVVALDGYAAQAMARLGLTDRIAGIGFTKPIRADREPYRGELARIPVLSADSVPVVEAVAAQSPDLVVTGFSGFGGPAGSPTDADLATMGAKGVAACLPSGPRTDLSPTYDFITKLGKVFRVPDRAATIVGELRAREQAVVAEYANSPRPRVLALGDNPVAGQPVAASGGGTIVNALIQLAGGTNVFAASTGRTAVSPEKVVEADPEVVLVVTDYSFAKTTGQQLIDDIARNPLLASTSAVKNRRILSSSQFLVGFPSPLNLDGLEQLATGLHQAGS